MWKCHKCGKPVYFAERKLSLGYNWHPECLRCEECGKRLNPGQHAEHKGVPYCHVPCYGALFGPQLFGHGTRVESHKSFGQNNSPKLEKMPAFPRTQLEMKLKLYNQFFEGKSGEIRCREVNGRLILEGPLRIYWGVQGLIHLKENDDQRTVVTVRKRNSSRIGDASPTTDDSEDYEFEDDSLNDISSTSSLDISLSSKTNTISEEVGGLSESVYSYDSSEMIRSQTLPSEINAHMTWDEVDDLLRVERKICDTDSLYKTLPASIAALNIGKDSAGAENSNSFHTPETVSKDSSVHHNQVPLNRSMSGPDYLEGQFNNSFKENQDILTHFEQSPDSPTNKNCVSESQTMSDRAADASEIVEFTVPENDASEPPNVGTDEVVRRRPKLTGSTAIRRRPGKRLSRTKVRRRCSINGHFYDRETSFFTPPYGSQTSVWVTSLVNTEEVINLTLGKYKVESEGTHFALFVVHDNGEQRRLKDDDYPLLARVMLGPHEDVAKIFLMDSHSTSEVTSEVAQFLNLSLAECRAILNQYYAQEEREINRVREKYDETKKRILYCMEELKVPSSIPPTSV